MSKLPVVQQVTSSGYAARLDALVPAKFQVAPTAGEERNTLRSPLLPKASWRIECQRFSSGSSFLLPRASDEFAMLAALRPANAKGDDAWLMSVFGHADAVGSDKDNKALSGRRAQAVYGVLTRNTDLWEELYSRPAASDRWGTANIRSMLIALGFMRGSAPQDDATLRDAVRAFQQNHQLATSGSSDAPTRKALFAKYMDHLCRDAEGAPYSYLPKDFLGRGADAKGKADYQGCGEVNPVVVLSKKQVDALQPKEKHEERDAAYRSNRRVTIYMFAAASNFSPERWPCPRATEGSDGCKTKEWFDAQKRREPGSVRREHVLGGNTFACRFYEEFAHASPTEQPRQTITVYLQDAWRKRMRNAEFCAGTPPAATLGQADEDGKAIITGVFSGPTIRLSWGAIPDTEPREYRYTTQLYIDIDDDKKDDEAEVVKRLANLGYTGGRTLEQNIEAFQRDHGLKEAEWPDDATRDALFAKHADGSEMKDPDKGSVAGEIEPASREEPFR